MNNNNSTLFTFDFVWMTAVISGKTVRYDSRWENGTGYLDGAVSAPVTEGKLVVSIDNFGREIILLGTPYETIVLFKRFPGKGTLVSNHSRELPENEQEMMASSFSDEVVDYLVRKYILNFNA